MGNHVDFLFVNRVDTLARTCESVGSLAVNTSWAASIIVHNTLYIFGGWNDGGTMDTYQYITLPTKDPTLAPTGNPTNYPSISLIDPRTPSSATESPTNYPSLRSTENPTNNPTLLPSMAATNNPTVSTINFPTNNPVQSVSNEPTSSPLNVQVNPTIDEASGEVASQSTTILDPTSLIIANSASDGFETWWIYLIVAIFSFLCCCLLTLSIIYYKSTKKKEDKTMHRMAQEIKQQKNPKIELALNEKEKEPMDIGGTVEGVTGGNIASDEFVIQSDSDKDNDRMETAGNINNNDGQITNGNNEEYGIETKGNDQIAGDEFVIQGDSDEEYDRIQTNQNENIETVEGF